MSENNKDNPQLPVLYICPYCKKGRFTAKDGFDAAKRHIKEKHPQEIGHTPRRKKPPEPVFSEDEDVGLLGNPDFE